MSAHTTSPGEAIQPPRSSGMTTRTKVLIGLGVWLGGTIALIAIAGFSGTRNTEFEPQNEFKLDSWVHLGAFSINKAVMYLVIAATLTCISMIYIARRMRQRPNRVQTAVEVVYGVMRNNIAGGNMDQKMAARWFP